MPSRIGRLAALLAAVALLVSLAIWAPTMARWLDRNLLDEHLKDTWGRLQYQEDWTDAPALPPTLDDTWLAQATRPVLVAHALGEASEPGQNTLAAMQRSIDRGIRLLEVDLWLDAQGLLRCHHGPDAPRPFSPGECTLPTAAQAALRTDTWLVLDIKTDFGAAGEALLRQMSGSPAASRLIFQLYRPKDVAMFKEWAHRLPLPSPIVTAYASHRSVGHLALHAQRLGVRALTLPLERIAALREPPRGMALLVHPVHDCDDVARAASTAAQGLYVRSSLVSSGSIRCIP